MRDYSKVSGQFWTGRTGKRLRGDMEGQLVALYLMTSPHANMIGVYQLPILYIAHETGLTIEGASKGLDSCIKGAFCSYDSDTETVFVYEMAAHQVGDVLKDKDLRRGAVQKLADAITETHIYQAFMARYAEAYGLRMRPKIDRGIEAPSKPLLSQKQEQEQKQEEAKPPVSPRGGAKREKSITLAEYLGDCQRQGIEPIPNDDAVWGYPESMGLPSPWVDIAWWAFQGRYLASPGDKAKRYASWRQAFRNAVRENWLKLWWSDGTGYRLTTAGVQAQREMEAAA